MPPRRCLSLYASQNSDARWLPGLDFNSRPWGWEHSFLINNSPSFTLVVIITYSIIIKWAKASSAEGFSLCRRVWGSKRLEDAKTNYSSSRVELSLEGGIRCQTPSCLSTSHPQKPAQSTNSHTQFPTFEIPSRHIEQGKDINLSIWCRNIFHPPFWLFGVFCGDGVYRYAK